MMHVVISLNKEQRRKNFDQNIKRGSSFEKGSLLRHAAPFVFHIQVLVDLRHLYLHTVEGDICQQLLAPSKIKSSIFSLPDANSVVCSPHSSG